MGFSTKRTLHEEVVTKVRPFDLALADEHRWRQVLRARIHPQVERLNIRRVALSGGHGVAYISVPPQAAELKPFLLHGASSRHRVRSHSITIPTRVGTHTEYETPAGLHTRLTAGRVALARLSDETEPD